MPNWTRDDPVTIRNLATYWGMSVEELIDLPISIGVHSGPGKFEADRSNMTYPNVHLRRAVPTEHAPGLRFDALLSEHRLVKRSARERG